LTKYYSLIFEQVRIPINLSHPATSGVLITHELLHNSEYIRIRAGIKDSNGDVKEYEAYVKEFLSGTSEAARETTSSTPSATE
jgi:hypothetical protein